jgi:hypothetical protein
LLIQAAEDPFPSHPAGGQLLWQPRLDFFSPYESSARAEIAASRGQYSEPRTSARFVSRFSVHMSEVSA